jgi:hypothetical protein
LSCRGDEKCQQQDHEAKPFDSPVENHDTHFESRFTHQRELWGYNAGRQLFLSILRALSVVLTIVNTKVLESKDLGGPKIP